MNKKIIYNKILGFIIIILTLLKLLINETFDYKNNFISIFGNVVKITILDDIIQFFIMFSFLIMAYLSWKKKYVIF